MFSVSLYFQLLINVGILANKSARTAKVREMTPFFVVIQIIIAMKDIIPQKISNFVVFQYESLLKNVAIKTRKGTNPARKVEIRRGI
jgi:hypothetical protein